MVYHLWELAEVLDIHTHTHTWHRSMNTCSVHVFGFELSFTLCFLPGLPPQLLRSLLRGHRQTDRQTDTAIKLQLDSCVCVCVCVACKWAHPFFLVLWFGCIFLHALPTTQKVNHAVAAYSVVVASHRFSNVHCKGCGFALYSQSSYSVRMT